MEQRLFDLLARDGVWLLFAAQMFGVFGLPIPDELLLTFAGGLVRRRSRSTADVRGGGGRRHCWHDVQLHDGPLWRV